MIPSVLEVIGCPIGHSLSPRMHTAALSVLAEQDPTFASWSYRARAVEPEQLGAYVAEARHRPELVGFNVTVPHKVAIVALLDRIEASARAVGAVNTVLVRGGVLTGMNTDVEGFARAAEQDFDLTGDALVIGAGGAARAVVSALSHRARSITVAARRISQAEDLAPLAGPAPFFALPLERERLFALRPSLVVQATHATLDDEAGAALTACIPLSQWPGVGVIDLVYRAGSSGRPGDPHSGGDPLGRPDRPRLPSAGQARSRTATPPEHSGSDPGPLLSSATSLGLRTQNGLPMLVYQGALALEQWTGRPVDPRVLHRALVLR